MSAPFELKTRFPVPRWVPSNIMAGTIFGRRPTQKIFNPVSIGNISELEQLWLATKSLFIAEELVNYAYFAKMRNEITLDAASTLLKSTPPINNDALAKAKSIIADTLIQLNPAPIRDLVSLARKKISINPSDPFAHLDLAFHFTTLRDTERANKHILTAKRFGEGNIYIARAITRFFLHSKNDVEESLEFIRKFAKLHPSPAAFASEISISLCGEVKSRTENTGFKLLKDNPAPNWDISELASIFASLELEHGQKKSAKKLAALSLASPNENSLAQVLSSFTIESPGKQFFQPSFDFESQAISAYRKAEYDKALHSATLWAGFQPFSTKPLIFMAYIYSVIYDNRQRALELCHQGRQISSDDFTINNNILFYQLKLGLSKNSEAEIERLKLLSSNTSESAVLSATEGLLKIRSGSIQLGKELYLTAVNYFDKSGNIEMKLRAKLFLIEELIRIAPSEYENEFNQILREIESSKEPDLLIFANRLKSQTYSSTADTIKAIENGAKTPNNTV